MPVKKSKKKTPVKRKPATKTKNKTVKKVTKRKPAAKKKVATKIKNTKKNPKKKPTKTLKATKEPITFNILQEEIDTLVQCDKENTEISQNLSKELARLIPEHRPVHKTVTHEENTVFQTIAKRKEFSPYVLDLNKMVEKKKQQEEKKKIVREFFQTNNRMPDEEEIQQIEIKTADKDFIEQFTKETQLYRLRLPINWYKSIAVYVVIALLVIIPIKVFGYYKELKQTQDQVVGYAMQAYDDLKIAGQSLASNNLTEANKKFDAASTSLDQAANELGEINLSLKAILKVLPTDSANLADAERLLDLGKTVSGLGNKITNTFETFSSIQNKTLTEKIEILQNGLSEILPDLQNIKENLNKIRPEAIPDEYVTKYFQIKDYINFLTTDFSELYSFSNSLQDILGKDYKRRYLFMFQNSNELRPTGGFMGSYALVDFDQGEITNMEIPAEGIYALKGSLSKYYLPPEPLRKVSSIWGFQDSNWFADFPTSAEKIKWFYEYSGGPTVDGVIAINSNIIPNLLEITGPVSLPQFNLTLTSDNFIEETQKQVEFNYDKEENKPKQIITDLAPIILEKIFSTDATDLIKVAKIFQSSLKEKQIQMYFANPAVQNKIANYNWAGEIKDSSRDYLLVVNSNIGGGKTDAYIQQKISLNSEIQNNGEIINTLNITRIHTGNENDVFGKTINANYIKIYVPEGSQLLSAEGFSDTAIQVAQIPKAEIPADPFLEKIQGQVWIEPETTTQINNEFNKTVFGNWLELKPGETKTVTVKYKLPFKFNFPEEKSWFNIANKNQDQVYHSILLQKQSGQQNSLYNVKIKLPETITPTKTYPNDIFKNRNLTFNSELSTDELIAFVID